MLDKIAIVGGSFDPVHLGHLHLIHSVYAETQYRTFVLIPTKISNFKRENEPLSDIHRLEMLNLAIEDYKTIYPGDREIRLLIDDCEMRRGGVSYTVETVRQMSRRFDCDERIGLVIGDDLTYNLHRWHDIDDLVPMVTFVVARRVKLPIYSTLPGMEMIKLNNEIDPKSSTDVRKGDKRMLSDSVKEYVINHDLYK